MANSETAIVQYASYMNEIYLSQRPPQPLGSVDWKKWEQLARDKFKENPNAFLYTFGSAGTCSTEEANRKAFLDYHLVPRMLVDVTSRTLSTTILGKRYPSPIIVAPIGVQGLLHPDAECASARAAAKVRVPFILSTAATRTIETVARANGEGERWYQLYWPKSDDVTLSLLKRAKDAGFTNLVVTLDTMQLGWRPHDLDDAYVPFAHGYGTSICLSDPVFMKKLDMEPITDEPSFPYEVNEWRAKFALKDSETMKRIMASMGALKELCSGDYKTWSDLDFLRKNWSGRILLKGILSSKDVKQAMAAQMDGVIVSNHGGRQVDGSIAALRALDKITVDFPKGSKARGDFGILFDSGIRTGSDVLKALALGADGVLVGRPLMYGLAIGGCEGVESVLKTLLADTEVTMGLCGIKGLDDISRESLGL